MKGKKGEPEERIKVLKQLEQTRLESLYSSPISASHTIWIVDSARKHIVNRVGCFLAQVEQEFQELERRQKSETKRMAIRRVVGTSTVT